MQSTFDPTAGLVQSLNQQVGNIASNPLIHSNPTGQSSYTVGASEYGQNESNFGSCRINTNTVYGFAELGPAPAIGHALGNLQCGTQLYLRNPANGKTVLATKVDVGSGGNPIGNLVRRIDLHYRTAQALGFNGTGPIEIKTLSGQRINASFSPGELLNPFDLGPFEKGPGQIQKEAEGLTNNLNPFAAIEKPFNELVKNLKAFFKFFELLSTPAGWLRIGKVLFGGILLLLALSELAKIGAGSTGRNLPYKAASVGLGAAEIKGVL